MTRVGPDPRAMQASDRDRAKAVHRAARLACRPGPVRLDARGPGARAAPLARAPGGGDLRFAWDGIWAEARARHGVAADLGPAPRNGARDAGVSLQFRVPDGSLIEFVACP